MSVPYELSEIELPDNNLQKTLDELVKWIDKGRFYRKGVLWQRAIDDPLDVRKACEALVAIIQGKIAVG